MVIDGEESLGERARHASLASSALPRASLPRPAKPPPIPNSNLTLSFDFDKYWLEGQTARARNLIGLPNLQHSHRSIEPK